METPHSRYVGSLLGTSANVLSFSLLGCLPESLLEYRVALDDLAYHRKEFRTYYRDGLFRVRWAESEVATLAEKHVALLCVFRLRFDDAIIDNIANFVSPGTTACCDSME